MAVSLMSPDVFSLVSNDKHTPTVSVEKMHSSYRLS